MNVTDNYNQWDRDNQISLPAYNDAIYNLDNLNLSYN